MKKTKDRKFYKVWIDVNWNQPFASFGKPIESTNDDSKAGDYIVFNTLQEAEAFIRDPKNYPVDNFHHNYYLNKTKVK